jgi:3-hydroxyacyl-CoA dehydrogenase
MAVALCVEGKPIAAADAHAAGLVDRVVTGDLVQGAIAFALEQAALPSPRRTRAIAIPADKAADGREAVRKALESLRGRRGPAAPAKAAEAVDAALTMSFDEGSARERELFADCVLSTESRALRYLFFAEREAAKPAGVPSDAPVTPVASAAVIGAGTMGVGIAMCYASSGIPVLLKDVSDEAVKKGMAAIRRNYEGSVSKGRITQAQFDRAMALVSPATSYDGFEAVDIVVEAAFEDMALKREIFATLGRVTRPACILASNTSTLDIDALADASGRPSQVVGHHFFSPANVMKLLEIVRGRETSDAVIASSLAVGKRLGKTCAVVGNCFGFVANRMLAYYMREAYLLLEEGASVAQIDRVVSEFGLPVGPFAMQDIAGIDVGARIRQHLAKMGKTRAEGPQSAVPDRLYEMGRYGQKTSAGWYRYEPGSRTPIPDPLIDEIAATEAARRGIERRTSIADEEIVARITTALANEGARVLEEGFASRPGDIDVIYCNGFGFPRYRGGPMFYADTVGLATVLSRVREYRTRFGDYWQPAALLERLAAQHSTFHDVNSQF